MSDLDVTHPFTTAQALAAGITPGQLRGPLFRQLFKGIHIAAATRMTPRLMAEAALLPHPEGAFASCFTAARVYGIPVPTDPDEHVSVRDPSDRRPRLGLRCHIAAESARVLDVRGLPLSAPAQVFVELAEFLPLVDLVVVGDYIARREWYTPEQLVGYCRHAKDRHAAKALKAARYVRDGVDSPMETRLRMLIVLAGLPEPTVNFKLYDEMGTLRRRLDLSYPGVRVIVEYDGRQHAEDTQQYSVDIDRREEFDDAGWRIVIVTAKGVYAEPERTLARVVKVLRARGMKGLPTHLSDQWRAHFPGYTPLSRTS